MVFSTNYHEDFTVVTRAKVFPKSPKFGRVDLHTANALIVISDVLEHANIDYDLLIDLNDSGYTFEEIADYLDRHYKIPN